MDRYSRRRLLAWLLSTHELWAYYTDPDVCVTIELKLPDLRRGVSLQMTPTHEAGCSSRSRSVRSGVCCSISVGM